MGITTKTAVPKRPFGSSGVAVSEIGFGTWGLGGSAYGQTKDEDSLAALRKAFDLGVTFYDTADLYGDGHAEELLAQAFGKDREKVILATKGGTLPHKTFEMPQDFSAAYLTKALEGSLRRLKTDYIDVYMLHSPELAKLDFDIAKEALDRAKAQGKIKVYGISVRSPADGMQVIKDWGVRCIEVNFNVIDQRAQDSGLFDYAAENGVGIVVRTPLCFGFLTGKLSGRESFDETDHRKNWPPEQLERWAGAAKLFEEIYRAKGQTPIQFALNFCLSFKAVSTVIPGMLTAEQVRENMQAVECEPFTKAELEKIQSIYRSHVFYDPKAKTSPPPGGRTKGG